MSPDNQLKVFFILFLFAFLQRLKEKNQFMWAMAQNWVNKNLKGIPLNKLFKIIVNPKSNTAESMDQRINRLISYVLSKKFNHR
jgi:hypothetical protein